VKRLQVPKSRSKRGFVLVLTLAMILFAVMITGRTANRSLSRTLQSIEAESELQRRWEQLSLQRTLLNRADRIFAAQSKPGQLPAIWHDGHFILSGRSYRVRLSDESAKVNLNQLQRVLKPEQFRSVLASLPRGASHPEHEPIESWGLLFGSIPTSQLMQDTTAITCWGDGRLNIHRASDDSIRLLLEPVVGLSEVDALIRWRNEKEEYGAVPLRVPQAAQELVTEQSVCHSLWSVDQGSEETRLDIRELMDRRSRETSFRW
jgi:hypothetical protein